MQFPEEKLCSSIRNADWNKLLPSRLYYVILLLLLYTTKSTKTTLFRRFFKGSANKFPFLRSPTMSRWVIHVWSNTELNWSLTYKPSTLDIVFGVSVHQVKTFVFSTFYLNKYDFIKRKIQFPHLLYTYLILNTSAIFWFKRNIRYQHKL